MTYGHVDAQTKVPLSVNAKQPHSPALPWHICTVSRASAAGVRDRRQMNGRLIQERLRSLIDALVSCSKTVIGQTSIFTQCQRILGTIALAHLCSLGM